MKVQNNTGIYTDSHGYAVIPWVSPYRRNAVRLDTSALADNVDITTDTQTVIPTQGALVLARYATTLGQKAIVTLQSSHAIPFGATASIKNGSTAAEGIVDEKQRVWLSGLPAQGVVRVSWGNEHCLAPYHLPKITNSITYLTARCQ